MTPLRFSSLKKNKGLIIWIGGAGISLLLLYFWALPSRKKADQIPNSQNSIISFLAPSNKDLKPNSEPFTQNKGILDTNRLETLEDWNQAINQYSKKLSSLTDSPDSSDKELTLLAESFPEKFLPVLKVLALDPQRSGDERILSIEILSRSQLNQSLSLLTEIALSPMSPDTNAARANEEMAFRAAAIEGLVKKNQSEQSQQQLKQILQKTDNSFLADRAERSLKALEGKAPGIEEQDRNALEKILRK